MSHVSPHHADHPVLLRPYAPADWPGVCRVHDAARVQELASGGVDPRAFRTMQQAAEADEFFASETLVACASDAVAGFVSWNGAYLTWLYVHPDHQRRGIGRRLLRAALARAGPDAWTTLIAGNAPALSLYLAEGLELVSTTPGHVEGHPAAGHRVALPTSRMRDPAARRDRAAALPSPPHQGEPDHLRP